MGPKPLWSRMWTFLLKDFNEVFFLNLMLMKNVENSELLSTLKTKNYLPLEAIIAMKATKTKTRNEAIFSEIDLISEKDKRR